MLKQLALATLAASTFTAANAYQAEVGGTYAYYDIDESGIDNGYTLAVDGTYYFAPVQVKNSPLNEAAFLNRASNVSANVAHTNFDDVDFTTYGVGVEYFVPGTNFYANASVAGGNKDIDTTWAAEVGYLPTAGLLVAVGAADNGDDTDATLRAKYVTKVANHDVNFEAATVFADKTAYALGADVYLDQTLSLGLGYADDGYNDSFEINAKKFFTQQVSVEGAIAFGDHVNTYGIRAAYRF